MNRAFIELPTWLGDAVMASCAIENLVRANPNVKITFFGAFAATKLYENHPNCEKIVIDESKKAKFRLLNLASSMRNLGEFDVAISFRGSFASKFGLKFLKSKRKFSFDKKIAAHHQAQKYAKFACQALKIEQNFDDLRLNFEPKKFENKTLGLNPGANYGSAKRWYPEYFAEVAIEFKDEFEILIFGGQNESEICGKIAEILAQNGVKFTNLCGKTSVKELCENIAGLNLFITNDSGPMHIAAAYKVPTIALFGPTKFDETSPYKNQNAKILHLNLECMPCMKRVCPLGHHACMKNLTPKMAIDAVKSTLAKNSL